MSDIKIFDGWNPIETAPNDEWVLITDSRNGDYIVGQSMRFLEPPSWDGLYYSSWVWAADYVNIECPTHWMKLPAKP